LVRVPKQTLRNWVLGYTYPRGGERELAEPVIRPPTGADGPALSFVNLIEALTLAGFREMGVPLQRVRGALDYAAEDLGIEHLLASERILTDGLDLFWRFQELSGEQLVNISRHGQKVFPEAVDRYLREVEWGPDRLASRWWPGAVAARQGLVVVDPRRAFGAPVVAGTGIRTEDVFSRFSAGESVSGLAEDFGLSVAQVEACVRVEASFLEPIAA